MLTASKLAKFFAERDRALFEFFKRYARDDDPPEPEPPPFQPGPIPKHETHLEALQRRNRDAVRSGRAVSASALKPPPPRPPRAPGQQRLQFNGLWSWWS